MKKKSIIIALVIGLIMAAQVSGQIKFGPKTETFLKIFASGNYHMKATTTADGVKADMEMFTKSGRIASTVSAEGETVRVVMRDNKTYMIMESLKTIMITAIQDGSQSGVVDTSKMTFTGTGTASFAGKNLSYEEYTEEGKKTRFFIDGNKLAGMRAIADGETMDIIISILDQNVPDSAFNIPSSGYQVQDMSNLKF